MCEGTAIKYDTPVAHRLCMRGAALCVYYCCVVFALPADYYVCRHYSCRQLYCLSDYSSARRSTLGTVRVLTTVTPDAQLRRCQNAHNNAIVNCVGRFERRKHARRLLYSTVSYS